MMIKNVISKVISIVSPVIAILQDHLLVPSRTICSACSRLSICVSGSTENVVLKRRQCPRHRIVLRQPLVSPFCAVVISRSLETARKRKSFRDGASSRRSGGVRFTEATERRGIVARREIVRNYPTAIQQQQQQQQ